MKISEYDQKIKEEVPGQLFRDVLRFHEKFGLKGTDRSDHRLYDNVLSFRYKFLKEELREYATACGLYTDRDGDIEGMLGDTSLFDAEKAFDALIDLVYVALGTAYLHRFPFDQGWARVQEANMRKVRATDADDGRSVRKHALDVVKPDGWEPPQLGDLL